MFEITVKAMPWLDWLTARPIAHRGLHDAAAGVIEKIPPGLPRGDGRQLRDRKRRADRADGEAMMFHDDELERLTEGHGELEILVGC